MKPTCCLITCFMLFCFFTGCSKDGGTANKDVFIISPQKIVTMNGEDWNVLKPQMENKKDYYYEEFPESQNPINKAVVALPAVEETNDSIFYVLLLTVDRSSNKINAINMETSDSMKITDKELAYSLILKYHNEGLKPVTDTTSTYGDYEMDNGAHAFTTVDNIITKLNSGIGYPEISVNYNSTNTTLSINAIQPANTNNYIFGFVGRSF